MKKKIIVILVFILIVSVSFGGWRYKRSFLATAVSCAKTVTVVNGTGFDSVKIPLPGEVNIGLLTVTFTRAAGSASTVDFYFQVSFDSGTTWANYRATISIPTNEPVISGTTCYVSTPVNLYGVSHIQMWKIVNNDASNDLTACNATISY